MYRNPRNEVQRFLDTRHSGAYRVYNVTLEAGRNYNATAPHTFHGNHARFPFFDHKTPSIPLMCVSGGGGGGHRSAP